MEIISRYVREQKRYSKAEIRQIFSLSSDEINSFIKNLLSVGILKGVEDSSEQRELSDLVLEDIEVFDSSYENEDCLFLFTYVGIITIGARVIKCYPKYLNVESNPTKEMKQIIKVISRYGVKEQVVNLYNGDVENSTFNILAVILFLLNDYHDYGLYNNTEDIIEVNGEGKILWDKTVNDGFSIVCNNKPYYMELYTGKNVDDEFDFFKRLHECILTECSKQLETADLLDIFDLIEVDLSREVIADFGDAEYLLYLIQSELSIQFNTRKQLLLKTIYAYVAHSRTIDDGYGISMYGTNNFNLIWEDVCSEVLGNKLQSPLSQLELPIPLVDGYNKNDKLIDVIHKPIWVGIDQNGSIFDKPARKTLIPDIIAVVHREGKIYQFVIMDAKYYSIQLEAGMKLSNQPGVEAVTKQYLYQLAYKDFLADHGICEFKNCFLMPSDGSVIVEKGIAKMEILSSLGLCDIQIRLLPASHMYDLYLNHSKLDVAALNL
jgi:hypothetical protein